MSKVIKCSKGLIENNKDIFKDVIGTQIYLAVASSHIRSQYFHDAICRVIEAARKKTPDTVE